MKKITCIILVLMLALACAASAESSGVSITTGRPTANPARVMVAQMDNEPAARPQKGIGSADIVYEIELYNGGHTRYTAVYNDTIPELIEAIRSTRIVNATVFSEYGGAYVYFGAQVYEGSNAIDFMGSKNFVKAIGNSARYNGIWVGCHDNKSNTEGASEYYRDKSRKAPHNVVAKMQSLYNMTDWSNITCKSPLKFNAAFTVPAGEDVTNFRIAYRDSYTPSYQWDAAAQRYLRLYNDKPFTDADTGAQVYADNVIVQHVEYSWYSGASDRPKVELIAKNTADYFIGGKHFTGTWERTSLDSNTVYYDANGNEVLFNPGTTFIQILKTEKDVEILG